LSGVNTAMMSTDKQDVEREDELPEEQPALKKEAALRKKAAAFLARGGPKSRWASGFRHESTVPGLWSCCCRTG